MLSQHCALIGKDLFQDFDPFRLRLWSHDRTIMNAAHAQRKNTFVTSILRRAVFPIFTHAIGVLRVVVVLWFVRPFGNVVAQHRLGV